MFFPRKSLSLTVSRLLERSVKSGAMSPSFKWVFGGACACASRLAAAIAPMAMTDSTFICRNPSQGDLSVSHALTLEVFHKGVVLAHLDLDRDIVEGL